MNVNCVIVGGGITGLAAAHELHLRRIPFVLVEGGARFGGLIRTETVDGFVVDAGPDALLTQKPAGIALCRELGVELSPAVCSRAFVAHHGQLRALPEAGAFGIPTDWKSFARSGALSIAGKLRIAAEYFLPPRPSNDDESIASFMSRRFGREALLRLGEPLLAGIHGGDAERLSMRALFPRLLDLERTDGSVIRGLRRLRRTALRPGSAPFVSVKGGTETLVSTLVASLPPSSLISKAPVRGLERTAGWRVHLANNTHVDTPAVLIATPPRATARLIRDVDGDLSSLLDRIRDVGLITVALGYGRGDVPHSLQGSGFVVPRDEGAGVSAVTWMSSKWRGRAPENGVLLRAAISAAREPDALARSDADLVGRVRADLHRYLHVSRVPLFARVYRMPHAGVQLEVGHSDLVRRAEACIERFPGLFMSGAGFRGAGIADCVGDARLQAAAVAQFAHTRKPVKENCHASTLGR